MPDGLGVQFRGGPTTIVFRGKGAGNIFDYLLATLDGSRSLTEIVASRPTDLDESELVRTLSLLHTKGLLRDGATRSVIEPQQVDLPADDVMKQQLLFWGRNLGITGYLQDGFEAQRKLATARIVIVGTGVFGAATWDLLSRSGCRDFLVADWDDDGLVMDSAKSGTSLPRSTMHFDRTSVDEIAACLRAWATEADIMVTATRRSPAQLFHEINRICLDANCLGLFANDTGTELELGPYVSVR